MKKKTVRKVVRKKVVRKKKPEPKTIRCTIINDWVGGAGQTGAEEAELIKAHVIRALAGHNVVFTTGDKMSQDIRADLLVFDYGGMANGYRTPFYDYCRQVVRWVEDHPSSLVVIGSTFTYDTGVQHELEESINANSGEDFAKVRRPWNGSSLFWQSPLPNLIIGYLISRIYSDEDLSDSEKAVRDWFA